MTGKQILNHVRYGLKHAGLAADALGGMHGGDEAIVLFHIGEVEGALTKIQTLVETQEDT